MNNKDSLFSPTSRVVTDQDAKEITRVEELAYDIKIREAMTRTLRTVSPERSMRDVLELLRQEHISGLPVLEDGALVGVISLEDLIRSMTDMDLDAPVRKYMSGRVITVNEFDPLIEAVETFAKSKVGRLPVVDQSGALVGMITKGDITRGVLIALQKDIHEEEVRRYRASHLFEDIISDRTSLILRYHIKSGDFIHGGNASSNIKRALVRLGASPQVARRCGIAVYEAEMNLIIHTTDGGMIKVEIEPHRILMKAVDDGPGIPDINLALQAGYSTATEAIRELGFGAGMGLPNIQRCVDRMLLESEPGKGTRLEMYIYLQEQDSFRESSSSQEEKPS
jgi:CBS domain-containing protein/anti-sigma regulatory factor (Ser/Thr protein kinase)